jgi:hypothetical protein
VAIRSIIGYFSGLGIKMLRQEDTSTPEKTVLAGMITIDATKALWLLDEGVAKALQKLKIGAGYKMCGEWYVPVNKLSEVAFKGKVIGRDCVFMGYHIKGLTSYLLIDKDKTEIKNLHFNDIAGSLKMRSMLVKKHPDGHWTFDVPLLRIEELRPSLLNMGSIAELRPKPLVIDFIEFKNIAGNIGDKSSYTGNGSLHFSNKTKGGYHSLWTFPVDIFTRLGLDMSLLTPVSGYVSFRVEDNRVVLTDFIDMYSHEKGSKFYLPQEAYCSYVDFDGNLDMKVKMKQFNILFKLAELFTISVKGTLENPEYGLSKQSQIVEEEPSKHSLGVYKG